VSQLQEIEKRAPVPECPYVGLRDYTEEYAQFFFGRDADRKRIIGNLRAARLTLLYAESGVGKSSLLRAGVVPRLRELAHPSRSERSSPRYVPVVFSSWGAEPTDALIDAIDDAIEPLVAADPELPRGALEQATAMAAAATGATLLVILDQFEELFLYHSLDGRGDTFAEQLARCINRSDLRANFLISIREDAYASVGDLLKSRVVNVYGNYLHLDYLDRDAARDAIVKPVERFNELRPAEPPIAIEPALVDAVLDQVRRGRVMARENEQAPESRPARGDATRVETTYLQLVMKRLWDEEMAAGSQVLRLEALERLGGAQTIIGTHLDKSMSGFSAEEQDAAATVFRFLVTSTGTKIALSADDLAELSGVPASVLGPMLRRLSAADLHILRPVVMRDSPGQVRFEIFHDALARPILDWRTRYAGGKLDAELEMERAQKAEAQREALEAAAREGRERRRKRLAIAGLIVAVVALIATATVFAVVQKNAADRKTKLAQSVESARRIVERRESPSFGPAAVALASLEASRRLSQSFEAFTPAVGVLQSNAGFPAIASGHTRAALAVAFVKKNVLASGSSDGTIRLWNDRGVHIGRPLALQNPVVSSLAVSAHGERLVLAAARGDGTVDLWDVTDPQRPKLTRSFTSSKGYESAVAFSPDGTLLAVGGYDAQVSIWGVADPSQPKLLGSVAGLGTVRALAFNPGGTVLFVAGDAGVASLAGPDFAHAQPAWLKTDRGALSVAVSPDGSLAIGVSDRDAPGITLMDPAGRTSKSLTTTGVVNGLTFARGGEVLVSGGADADVTTWDVATGRPFGPPRTEESTFAVNGVALSPDGRTIAEAGESGRVKLWPLVVERPLATTLGSLGPGDIDPQRDTRPRIYDLALGRDGQVAAATFTGGAVIWKDSAGRQGSAPTPLTTIPPASGQNTRAVAYQGNVLAVGSGYSVTMWDTGRSCKTMPRTPCRLGSTPEEDGVIWSLAFDRTGKRLAAGYDDGFVRVWDVSHPKAVPQTPLAERSLGSQAVFEVAFSPTADVLAAGGGEGTFQLWRVRRHGLRQLGKPVVGHEHQIVSALAFAPDGKVLASGGGDQQVALWAVDAGSRQPVKQLRGRLSQSNTIEDVAFSPSGTILAAGDGDGSVCLYDVKTREAIGSNTCLTEHWSNHNLSGIWTVAFRHDGSGLLAAGDGNPLVEWSSALWAESGDDQHVVADAVCRLAGRNLTQDEWNDAFVGTQIADGREKTCPSYPLP
jgi:WD40 repeat protein